MFNNRRKVLELANKLNSNDMIEVIGKTVLSAIPIGGALFASVWDAVKSKALEHRLEEWKKQVENRLSRLDNELEEIGDHELFTTCLLKTTEQAIKTSQKYKKEMLANALVNSLVMDIEEDVMMIFLDLLSSYTYTHLLILGFFSNPTSFENVRNSKVYMAYPISHFYETYPNLKNDEDFIRLVIKHLSADGLLSSETIYTLVDARSTKLKRTTELGDKFIEFILSNEEKIGAS